MGGQLDMTVSEVAQNDDNSKPCGNVVVQQEAVYACASMAC